MQAWLKWRGERNVPLVDNIRPEDLGRVLASVIVTEIELPHRIEYRLVGGEHDFIANRSLKGVNILDLVLPENRAGTISMIENFLRYPCGLFVSFPFVRESGATGMTRSLWLPVEWPSKGDFEKSYGALDSDDDGTDVFDDPVKSFLGAEKITYIDIGCGGPIFD